MNIFFPNIKSRMLYQLSHPGAPRHVVSVIHSVIIIGKTVYFVKRGAVGLIWFGG